MGDDLPGTEVRIQLCKILFIYRNKSLIKLDIFPVSDWRNKLEPVFLEFEDGCVPEEHYYPCIRRREDEEPKISAEEEYYLMVKEVEDSKVFFMLLILGKNYKDRF